jgi:hypothetical protein
MVANFRSASQISANLPIFCTIDFLLSNGQQSAFTEGVRGKPRRKAQAAQIQTEPQQGRRIRQ